MADDPEDIGAVPKLIPKFGEDTPYVRRPKKKVLRVKVPKRFRKKRGPRPAPIWQRIEGEWTPYRCRTCKSVTFLIIDEEDPFVNVQCAAGHSGKVLKGFAMTKPDG